MLTHVLQRKRETSDNDEPSLPNTPSAEDLKKEKKKKKLKHQEAEPEEQETEVEVKPTLSRLKFDLNYFMMGSDVETVPTNQHLCNVV